MPSLDPLEARDPDFIRGHLPALARYTSYFTPEVRGLDRLPAAGPVLVVGNHSCLFYMPEAWTCGQAVLSRRGVDAPAYALGYDLLFAIPGVGPFLRRLGVIPASNGLACAALARRACVLVYPGGDLEACRPWAQRNKIDFAGRKGFVRLALRCGVPVVPVVAHGGLGIDVSYPVPAVGGPELGRGHRHISWPARRKQPGGLPHRQTDRLHVDVGVGQPLRDRLERADRPPELYPGPRVLRGQLQRPLDDPGLQRAQPHRRPRHQPVRDLRTP